MKRSRFLTLSALYIAAHGVMANGGPQRNSEGTTIALSSPLPAPAAGPEDEPREAPENSNA